MTGVRTLSSSSVRPDTRGEPWTLAVHEVHAVLTPHSLQCSWFLSRRARPPESSPRSAAGESLGHVGELGARATTTTHALPPGRGASVGARYVRARAADADGGHSHVRPICTPSVRKYKMF
jgi:hypothetical protein